MSEQVTADSPKLFIGLDIHKKSWRFHFTTDLFSGSGHTFSPGSKLIQNYVLKNYTGLASYVGFIPSMQQSGKGLYTGGSTPRANRIM